MITPVNRYTGLVPVIGTIRAFIQTKGAAILISSDARWKENIEPIDNALNLVTQLRGVSYDWIDWIA